MLDIIKQRLFNISGYSTASLMADELRKLAGDIEKFQSEDATTSDMHRTFRMMERYSTMYKVAVEEYLALPTTNLEKRSFQLQEILCLLTLLTTLIAGTLRKYNTAEDKGTLGKYIRTLSNNLEQFKNDKISWTTMLKATTTMIEERIVKTKERIQEITMKVGE